jgi:hypothetical protein
MILLAGFLRSLFISRETLVLENLALRQQLAAYKRTPKGPRLRAAPSHAASGCAQPFPGSAQIAREFCRVATLLLAGYAETQLEIPIPYVGYDHSMRKIGSKGQALRWPETPGAVF